MNADVVKANLDRMLDPNMGSPLAFLFDMIESVEVIDEYTVEITTTYPFSALPLHLAHPRGHMISLVSIENDDEERLELYKKAQQIIIDEAPIIPIYHSVLLAELSDRVD